MSAVIHYFLSPVRFHGVERDYTCWFILTQNLLFLLKERTQVECFKNKAIRTVFSLKSGDVTE